MKKLNRRFRFLVVILEVFMISIPLLAQQDIGYRKYVMLDVGDSISVTLYDGTNTSVKLLEVEYVKDKIRKAIREARIKLMVDGQERWIVAGNYNLPEEFEHVKIDCPITQEYEKNGFFPDGAWRLTKEVKLRIWPEGKLLCPENFFYYPINQKWFATNTTHFLEPVEIDHDNLKPHAKDKIYYHWGEDIAGVKAVTEVLAAGDGTVIAVGEDHLDEDFFKEISSVQPRFDRIFVKMDNGWVYRYSHLHSFSVTLGQRVKGGTEIAKLGNHWSDFAHMHFEMWSIDENGKYIIEAAYPYFFESYVRDYHPDILANARPHKYIAVGDTVTLDASKSVSFKGNIIKYDWTFHDGEAASGERVNKQYNSPGYFSEMVKVEDDQGNVEYDFVHVTVVYENQPEMRYGYTSLSYHPSFDIHAGDELIFKGRFFNIDEGEDHWDFGDGTPVQITHSNPNGNSESGYAKLHHTYEKPGHYIVTFSRTIDDGTTSTNQLSIFVQAKLTSNEAVHEMTFPETGFKLLNIQTSDPGTISFSYSICNDSILQLDIIDINGNLIHRSKEVDGTAGTHLYSWRSVEHLLPGIYFVRFHVNSGLSCKQFLIV